MDHNPIFGFKKGSIGILSGYVTHHQCGINFSEKSDCYNLHINIIEDVRIQICGTIILHKKKLD